MPTGATTRRLRRLSLFSAVASLLLAAGLGGASTASAAVHDGGVLPASSPNHGWTLERAITATSAWNSGPRTSPPPATPFQILFVTDAGQSSRVGNGTVVRHRHSFSVPAGTTFFLPVAFADDSPPVAGTFPTTHTQALGYWYGKNALGTRLASIAIDGRSTPLSHDYLVGPLRARLSDGSGKHVVEEAAFLSQLPKGHHVIDMTFTWAGALIRPAFGPGFGFFTNEATFDITVA
jgi:hypothetical protein